MGFINDIYVISGGSTTGDFLVRFIDFDGTILKQQWVNNGDSATAPTPPTHDLLTFQEWNNDYDNITHNLDVGATYYTTDGKTYLFMRFTNTTGKKPTIYLNKADTSLMTVTWADGETTTSSSSGNVALEKPNDYAVGDYTVTIDCGGNWSFYTYIFNNNVAYNSCLLKCYLGNSVTSIGTYAFRNCYSLTSIVIPDGIISIGNVTFYQCFSLASIVIPDGIISIGDITFYQCFSLASIVIPDGVTSIGNNTFYQCFSLASIVIPDGVTSIVDNTFHQCRSLASIVIPDGIISIGNNAFYGNYSNLKYTVLATTPPSLASTNAFTSINLACKMYVPDDSLTDYQGATNWVTYANYFYPISELPEYDGTIFFQSNGGTAVKQITGTVGAVATEPTAPTKAGFTFDGWYKEAGLTTAWNWATDVYPTTNLTLYAKWI